MTNSTHRATMIRHALRLLRRLFVFSGGGVIAVALLVAAYCGVIISVGNVHTVAKGQLYRSAQLGDTHLKEVVREYGIKSILNLRGEGAGQDWYNEEVATSKALDVKHYDYGIWASSEPSAKQIRDIIAILRTAPKPLLIHCQSGADRSGLVAALYVAAIERRPADLAAQQLSLVYGHFPWLTSRTGAMDKTFWRYVTSHRSGNEKIVGPVGN